MVLRVRSAVAIGIMQNSSLSVCENNQLLHLSVPPMKLQWRNCGQEILLHVIM